MCYGANTHKYSDHPTIDREPELIAELNDKRVPAVMKKLLYRLKAGKRRRDSQVHLDSAKQEVIASICKDVGQQRDHGKRNNASAPSDDDHDQNRADDKDQNTDSRAQVQPQMCGQRPDKGTPGKAQSKSDSHNH